MKKTKFIYIYIYIIGKLHMHYVVLNTQSHPSLTLVGEGSTI